ncbi:MAG: alpha/beta hydrolase [Acidobacteria bacterium]|nr:MAG: alpha/beta hydrolase [Acidobacteriota bacterium]
MDERAQPIDRWRAAGREVEVFGQRIFYLERGPRLATPLLLLHGFPSSSFDFHRVIDAWAERYRVVVHDHPGFGFSAKPAAYSYSLLEQAETAIGLWRQLGIGEGHLLAHDYGTSVATELLARRARGLLPLDLKSVTLCNGSVHLELARLRLAQRLARSPLTGPLFGRLVPGSYVKRVLRRLWGDPRRARDADLEGIWRAIRHGDGQRRTHQISSYLDERVRFRHRWAGALRWLDVPVHVLWGRRDPVAVPAIAEKLAQEIVGSTLTWLEDLGHYPMLEQPEAFAGAALDFLARADGTRS